MQGKESWTVCIDWLGRPTLANAVHAMHYRSVSAIRKKWREAGGQAATVARIPALPAVGLTVQARYSKKPLCDPDAPAPSLKGVLDGFVDAGVIPDDNGTYVKWIKYLAPALVRGEPDALLVRVERIEIEQVPQED